jgi:plasmid stability protein
MMATLNIKNMSDALYKKLKARAKKENRSLSQEVTRILTDAVDEPAKLNIMGLRGLGKGLWKGIDPAKYIEEERNSWD